MQPVSKIVASGTAISRLGAQLSTQKALYQQLIKLLPTPLDTQLKAAVLQNGTLSLFVPSPVWASRFRYLLPQLHKKLQSHGIHVDQVRTRILPSDSAKPKIERNRHPITLSPEVRKQLRQTAEAIDDPSLRDAILRISHHGDE
ncbi:MAG: DciA family protein [Candidatus Thiodiazotropha sp.]